LGIPPYRQVLIYHIQIMKSTLLLIFLKKMFIKN